MRLLIADRDSTERTGIQWLVTSYSMKFTAIHQAADMVSLMKEIEEYQPTVLLIELEMIPPFSWDIFVRAIERYAGVVIAVTTEAVFERAWQALQLQAAGLLIKPLSPDRIKETLKRAVRSKRKKELTSTEAAVDEGSWQNFYVSLFFDHKELAVDLTGMMVVQPEESKAVRGLSEWLENYPFVHQPYILPLRDHVVCLLPASSSDMIYSQAQRIVRDATGLNGGNLFIAYTSIGYSSTTIHAYYEKALHALKIVFFKGHQQIVQIQDAPPFLDIDPFLTPAQQRVWMEMLEGGDKLAIKRWMYEQFTEFPKGFPDPELLRIRLTSILAHLRRFMQTYQLEKISQMEIRYQEIFQTILHNPVLFRIVQEVLLFIFEIVHQAKSQKENAHSDFIERGLRYIDEHFHRSTLSLEEVANYVQRSPSYFSHILSEKRAQSFRQYVTDLRMKQAKHLLVTTAMTIREVGYAVGYDDPNYFSRLFKECTGCSPRLWRNTKNIL